MNNYILISSAFIIGVPLLLTISDKVGPFEDDKAFILKKVIDCVAYSVGFLLLVYMNYGVYAGITETHKAYLALPCAALAVFSLGLFTYQFIYFVKHPCPINKSVLSMTLISLMVGVLMAFSTINYAVYILWPHFYEIPSKLAFGETAFEFIYYTFTLAITYSSSSISATHVITKIVQIFEICYFYVIFGTVIAQLIDRIINQSNNEVTP